MLVLTLACGVGILLVLRAATIALHRQGVDDAQRCDILRATTWAVVLCAWPAIWRAVATCHGCARCSPILMAWPYSIMLAEMGIIFTMPTEKDDVVKAARMIIEPATLASVTFAIAGLVGAFKDPIKSRFFVTAMMIILLFVFPTPVALPNGEARVVVDSAQRAMTTIAAALVACGVMYRAPTFEYALKRD